MEMVIKKKNLMEKVKEIQEEKDYEKRRSKFLDLECDVEWPFMFPHILDELIHKSFNDKFKSFSEMEVYLFLYCILVNGLGKTKGEKFEQVKKEMQPLIKKLKGLFSEFDKKELHEERTFIFSLRSPAGFHDDLYIIDDKDILKFASEGDIKCMFLNINLNKDEKDEWKHYYEVSSDYCLQGGKKN